VRLFYALGIPHIGIFCWGVYVQIRKYRPPRCARRKPLVRTGHGGEGVEHARRSTRSAAAAPPAFIFYGFRCCSRHATITLQYDILEPLFASASGRAGSISSSRGARHRGTPLGRPAYMMYRRGWMKLPKLNYARPTRARHPDFLRPGYRARLGFSGRWSYRLHGFLLRRAPGWLHPTRSMGHALVVAVGPSSRGARIRAHGHGGACCRLSLWCFTLWRSPSSPSSVHQVKHIFTSACFPDGAGSSGAAPDAHTGGPGDAGVAKITDFHLKQLLNSTPAPSAAAVTKPAARAVARRCPRDVILSLRIHAQAAVCG